MWRSSSRDRSSCGDKLSGLFALAIFLYGGSIVCVGQLARTNELSPALPQIVESLRSGHPADAVALCDTEIEAFPGDYRLWSLRGIALDQMRRKSEALASYLNALDYAPNYVPALQGAAKIAFEKDDPRADQLLKHLTTLNPADETAHVMSAMRAFHRGDCETAIDQLRLAGERYSADRDVRVRQAACLNKLQRFDEALPVLRSLLLSDPADERARFDLALCQLNLHESDEASETIGVLVQKPDADEDILTLAADIYLGQGNGQKAAEVLRRAIALHPDHSAPYLRFASLANDARSFEAGITILSFGIGHAAEPASLYLARGVLYSQLYNYEKAEEDFSRANELDPRLDIVHAAEGVMQSQQQKQDLAIANFRQAINQHPTDALPHYLLAEALSHEGSAGKPEDSNEELAEAKHAVDLDPKMVAARDLLAGIYLQDGQSDLAIIQSEASLAVDPKDQNAIYHLILALRKTDRKERIVELVKQLSEVRRASQFH